MFSFGSEGDARRKRRTGHSGSGHTMWTEVRGDGESTRGRIYESDIWTGVFTRRKLNQNGNL